MTWIHGIGLPNTISLCILISTCLVGIHEVRGITTKVDSSLLLSTVISDRNTSITYHRAHDETDQVGAILDLLIQGEAHVSRHEIPEEIVLVLGNTGAGKSTFVLYIAEDAENLYSQETGYETNEFTIKDKKQRVSNNSTITSQTTYPDLVFDAGRKTAFYDCPGFSDTRTPANDISAAYLIKKVIDSAKKVKLVFVVGYPSVRKGVDRQDFMRLVGHITTMVTDIGRFQDSISIMVTKVDNTMKRGFQGYVPDVVVIRQIAAFIHEVKEELLWKPVKDKQDENALQFLETLLTRDDENNYVRIGIFRRPDEAGPLNNVTLLRDGKKKIQTIIYNNTEFTAHARDDFGYTLSADSQLYVVDLVKVINNRLSSLLTNIGQIVEQFYQQQEDEYHDLALLQTKFTTADQHLSKINIAIMYNNFVLANFTEMIIKKCKYVNIPIIPIKEIISNITTYDTFLQFLSNVSNRPVSNLNDHASLTWKDALTHTVKYLNDSQKWYTFLIRLLETLSEYKVQRDITKYDITYWVNKFTTELSEISIRNTDLKLFLDLVNVENQNTRMYGDIEEAHVNMPKLSALRRVLQTTLNYSKVIKSCESDKLIMKGEYFKLSDLQKEKTYCDSAKFIEIFASTKIFIDASLDRRDHVVQLSIISPVWDVVSTANVTPAIILDGKPGEAHYPPQADNGRHPGMNGEDGKPGLPGESAANFLGIAKFINNKQLLHISAVGGAGGPGQGGGNGADGLAGSNCWQPTSVNDIPLIWIVGGFSYDLSYNCNDWWKPFQSKCSRRCYGGRGETGAQGGNGGKKGIGGDAGKVVIITLLSTGKQRSRITARKGHLGLDGAAGDGGLGGRNGRDLIVIKTGANTIYDVVTSPAKGVLNLITHFNKNVQWEKVELKDEISDMWYTSSEETENHSGKPGSPGMNTEAMQEPEKSDQLVDPSNTVKRFKNYLRDSLIGHVQESSMREFYKLLEANQNIANLE